mmetsp:Transcript_82066/g.254773  ORF Transcript_82066/g.254773 Transcript_82066/m.254773 type:complete len:224 (+) Transcript_82066:91-762(+)
MFFAATRHVEANVASTPLANAEWQHSELLLVLGNSEHLRELLARSRVAHRFQDSLDRLGNLAHILLDRDLRPPANELERETRPAWALFWRRPAITADRSYPEKRRRVGKTLLRQRKVRFEVVLLRQPNDLLPMLLRLAGLPLCCKLAPLGEVAKVHGNLVELDVEVLAHLCVLILRVQKHEPRIFRGGVRIIPIAQGNHGIQRSVRKEPLVSQTRVNSLLLRK